MRICNTANLSRVEPSDSACRTGSQLYRSKLLDMIHFYLIYRAISVILHGGYAKSAAGLTFSRTF
jgi:hypothetical protein